MEESKPAKCNTEPGYKIEPIEPSAGTSSGGSPNYYTQLNFFGNSGISPDDIEVLDRMCPGFATQFLSNIAEEPSHRRKMENRNQWMEFTLKLFGMLTTCFVVALAMIVTVIAVIYGSSLDAIASIIGSIMIIVSIIFGSAIMKRKPEKVPHKDD